MALREDTRPARAAVRYGRHGRPGPIGGRLRLPTIRLSGAAMAMSTVVGISVATTWLLSEQQATGRRPGMSSVGASPPLPSPDAPDRPTAEPAGDTRAASAAPHAGRTRNPAAPPAALTSPRPRSGTRAPAAATAPASASGAPGGSPAPGSAPARPAAPPVAAPAGSLQSPGPDLLADDAATPKPHATEPLAGHAVVELIGPTGTRHTLALTVEETVTALQVELRLARPDVLPGTAPASTLPGVVTTVSQEHGALVCRYTLPAGLDVAPGTYTFEVTGSRLPGRPRPAGQETWTAGQETWTAAAFVPDDDDPHAVAVRGAFG